MNAFSCNGICVNIGCKSGGDMLMCFSLNLIIKNKFYIILLIISQKSIKYIN